MNMGEEGDGDIASVHLVSESLATDGGYIAIGDMARILNGRSHRLIGGIAVMIHLQRLGSNLPIRATGDADFGVPLGLLQDDALCSRLAFGRSARRLGTPRICGAA